MAFYSEKILDDTVEGEKPLGLAGRFESAQPFPLAGWLMRGCTSDKNLALASPVTWG